MCCNCDRHTAAISAITNYNVFPRHYVVCVLINVNKEAATAGITRMRTIVCVYLPKFQTIHTFLVHTGFVVRLNAVEFTKPTCYAAEQHKSHGIEDAVNEHARTVVR